MGSFGQYTMSPGETFDALRATLDYVAETARLEYGAGKASAEVWTLRGLFRRRKRKHRIRRERDIIRKLLIFKSLKKKWDRRKQRQKLSLQAQLRSLRLPWLRRSEPDRDEYTKAASVNDGFYGARILASGERYTPYSQYACEHSAAARHYAAATARIVNAFGLCGGSFDLKLLRQAAPCDDIRAALAAAKPRAISDESVVAEGRTVYSILTPFFEHRTYFQLCAESVDALIQADIAHTAAKRIEWIVVNDDPRFDTAALEAMLPQTLRPYVRILSDGLNKGIARRLNEAAAAAHGQWLLLLDCDDEIVAEACTVLDHYATVFPLARYMSSSMIDLREDCGVLRFRRQEADPTFLFENGMTAGHLVAIRRDLFAELGGYREWCSGCQDYDFALRTALKEPLLSLPEYLYRYRWHDKSQSVAKQQAQEQRTVLILRTFLGLFANAGLQRPATVVSTKRRPVGTGHCIIRTQGKCIELLAETLESLRWQSVPIRPMVVVHGDEAMQDRVRSDLTGRGLAPMILCAPRTDRRRGHPMNVALDHLRFSAPNDDYFFFLDDDDIVYPFFAERLTKLLDLTNADVAVAVANRREPWAPPVQGHQLLPISALLVRNFIPIHCYVTRVETLRRTGVRCREDMDYLEDWDLLVGLLGGGARFHLIGDVLCEYRILGDGNTVMRRDPVHFQECRERVKQRSELVAKRLGVATYARDLSEFDFSMRAAIEGSEIGQLRDARTLFETKLSR